MRVIKKPEAVPSPILALSEIGPSARDARPQRRRPGRRGSTSKKRPMPAAQQGHMHHRKPEGNEIEGNDEHTDERKGDARKQNADNGMLHERKGEEFQ